ncbi:ATP-dependent DNA helicase [Ceratobasidium sp. AG-Ba]|nr:ATP-dependent DNA helicase [Ceratobasidium sp. AG-Ba]
MASNTQFPPVHLMTREGLQNLVNRANVLKASGHTNQSNQELHNINQYLNMFKRMQMARSAQAQQAQAQAQAQLGTGQVAAPTPKPALDISTSTNTNGHTTAPSPPQSPPTPITFNQNQLNTLRSQISAWKYLQRGMPVPLEIQQSIFPSSNPEAKPAAGKIQAIN